MKLAVGAPVAERGWILPTYLDCLSRQTVQPDYYRFVYSKSKDDTLSVLNEAEQSLDLQVFETTLPYYSRDERGTDRKDPWRATHMSKLRNRLRALFLQTDADVFLSLDTDILLEDETIIEQMLETLQSTDNCDLVAARTSLHALHDDVHNVGWFTDRVDSSSEQAWRRAEDSDLLIYKPPIQIDIPMAVFVVNRFTHSMCRYKSHAQGEDIGYAQTFLAHRFKAVWRPDLVCRHVWGPSWWEVAV